MNESGVNDVSGFPFSRAGARLALVANVTKGPDVVYILKSDRHLNRFYTGITTDIAQRLEFHNAGLSRHTATGRPWSLVATIQFADEVRAAQFEAYLKSGSGRAFAARHFR